MGLLPGDTFMVQSTNDEGNFDVVVPEGTRGGDIIIVQAPSTQAQPHLQPRLGTEHTERTEAAAAERGIKKGVNLALNIGAGIPGLGNGLKLNLSLATVRRTLSPAHRPDARAPPPRLTTPLSSRAAALQKGKFDVGKAIEVLRSDGTWSAGKVVDYEWRGGTYTVILADGRSKYLVEEEDIRKPGEGRDYEW